jgi:hypothetical protein
MAAAILKLIECCKWYIEKSSSELNVIFPSAEVYELIDGSNTSLSAANGSFNPYIVLISISLVCNPGIIVI